VIPCKRSKKAELSGARSWHGGGSELGAVKQQAKAAATAAQAARCKIMGDVVSCATPLVRCGRRAYVFACVNAARARS